MCWLLRVILYRGQQQPIQQQGAVPCARELEEFIKCTQTSNDLKFCEGLNYMFKQCKMDQGTTHSLFIATSDSALENGEILDRLRFIKLNLHIYNIYYLGFA